jgi:hypothetical protein
MNDSVIGLFTTLKGHAFQGSFGMDIDFYSNHEWWQVLEFSLTQHLDDGLSPQHPDALHFKLLPLLVLSGWKEALVPLVLLRTSRDARHVPVLVMMVRVLGRRNRPVAVLITSAPFAVHPRSPLQQQACRSCFRVDFVAR